MVTRVGRESWGNGDGHAGKAEMLMVIAEQDSHQAAKRVSGVYLLFVVFFGLFLQLQSMRSG